MSCNAREEKATDDVTVLSWSSWCSW